jgi:hypothetical protein
MDMQLKRLATRLERLGMVVAPFGGFLSVRLPLWCRVHVSVAGGRLRCEAYTGTVTRSRATLIIFGTFTALLATSFAKHGITADALTIGFLAVLGVAWEVIRYVITEGCITRVQALVLAEPALLDDDAALAAGDRPALGIGTAAAVDVRQRAGVQVPLP